MNLKQFIPDKKAFTGLLIMAIMAIMIGSILLIVSYVIISSVYTTAIPSGTACVIGTTNTSATWVSSAGVTVTDGRYSAAGLSPMCTNGTLNASFSQTGMNIAQALTIAGLGLIVAGIAGIVYMLIGLGGTTGRKR